ncbi:hypothetical protein F4821DRAFT_137541 [Hypoxylon rubiginosum]|uniref:Uncharacterized protein n=1 Tax=Hypoxylon rubiginosum TaxID=110542 RepID=A0ACC0DIM2_9PEZI|nr:hypothetical protein F4821DRAFT_137541 [Hypoxylon rubiginosum]
MTRHLSTRTSLTRRPLFQSAVIQYNRPFKQVYRPQSPTHIERLHTEPSNLKTKLRRADRKRFEQLGQRLVASERNSMILTAGLSHRTLPSQFGTHALAHRHLSPASARKIGRCLLRDDRYPNPRVTNWYTQYDPVDSEFTVTYNLTSRDFGRRHILPQTQPHEKTAIPQSFKAILGTSSKCSRLSRKKRRHFAHRPGRHPVTVTMSYSSGQDDFSESSFH